MIPVNASAATLDVMLHSRLAVYDGLFECYDTCQCICSHVGSESSIRNIAVYDGFTWSACLFYAFAATWDMIRYSRMAMGMEQVACNATMVDNLCCLPGTSNLERSTEA